jgi:TetR/AcrR family transcriptional regulator of autoinduction and epiphytic fitness
VSDGGDSITVDGRRQRTERSRIAVTDAVFELLHEGRVPPTAEEIAERSGVSVSSIFRHFTGLEDLQRHTLERFRERFGTLFDIPDLGTGNRATRITNFVAGRVGLYVEAAPIMAVARLRAIENAMFLGAVREIHATLAEQVQRQFVEELSLVRDPLAPEDLALAIDALTSPAAWDLMRVANGRREADITAIWTTGIGGLINSWAGGDVPTAAGSTRGDDT